ncbi:hypothetical protein FB565_007663 [Actinoplanes lutulentus]|uniref:Uncharacterized protein n=1 Tax=Actinoplanes lutulentus TaxID=1287878 RepID=A0A327ZLS7_9ACTN|nr:hypothetical protein [Actinoplanes lutulentus]MBB2947892.1 hypothetical protein [Actinoplanes lutulentus]RAK40227.1 hypothetical protein B0I29_103257 [Actinoplanes lutulentus]
MAVLNRLITVDGVVYRWRVRKRPSHPSPLSFAVERADRRGAILLATVGGTPGDWIGTATVPALVATMVRQAQDQGWHPDQPGPAFALRVPEMKPAQKREG